MAGPNSQTDWANPTAGRAKFTASWAKFTASWAKFTASWAKVTANWPKFTAIWGNPTDSWVKCFRCKPQLPLSVEEVSSLKFVSFTHPNPVLN